ncbi:MAG: hypothetical protein GY749_18675 [Desulfobacteraceae bacterium]|nr:hypothetical protein [Desulfobacteraceae bacterium]
MLFVEPALDDDGVARVWTVIMPPGYNEGEPPVKELPVVDLASDDGARYKAVYDDFTIAGTYRIAFYAMDNTGLTTVPKLTEVLVSNPISHNKGDINGDGNVDLTDIIICLKVLAGTDVAGMIREDYAASGVDADGDWKIGLEDALYILQSMGGLNLDIQD